MGGTSSRNSSSEARAVNTASARAPEVPSPAAPAAASAPPCARSPAAPVPVPQPAAAAADTGVADKSDDEDEEKLCRYCFEGEEGGELVSPCKCAGGQKWVHLHCLRQWQRGVLVSQPTHPDFYDDDLRHRVCGVCKSPFTCRPPTRMELMSSFTGEELAALVEEGCLIGTHKDFSLEMRRQVEPYPPYIREAMMDRHWIDGVFLIVKVVEDRGVPMRLQIQHQEDVQTFASALAEDWSWQLGGRLYTLAFEGPLSAAAGGTAAARRQAVANLRAPCTLKLTPSDEGDCGEDGIVAVGLTRPVDITAGAPHASKLMQYQAALRKALGDGEELRSRVTHFLAGPCREASADFGIVVSNGRYEVITGLGNAILAAQVAAERATAAPSAEAIGDPGDAQPPRPRGASELQPAAKRRREGSLHIFAGEEAEGEAAAERSDGEDGGSGAREVPTDVHLMIFWGTAGWSRCQLMGEIASGSWGLCKAFTDDVVSANPEDVYESVYPRLVFAPKTEMSENYGQQSAIDEGRRTRILRLHRRLWRRQRGATADPAEGTPAPGRTPAAEQATRPASLSDSSGDEAYSDQEEDEDEEEAGDVPETDAITL